MDTFQLPHHHGAINEAALHQALTQSASFYTVADILKQLADPTRLKIFWLLCHYEECVINIAALLDMTSPAVSHHLRSLHDAGLITAHRDGKEVYYKAAQLPSGALLHKTVEQMMEITCPAEKIDYTASTDQIIRNIHTYLVEHLAERITIEDLSKRFLMNPTTLKKAFKEVYGTSLAAHMKQHRMEQAARLLLSTNMPVGQIALAVGYESQSRFTTAFKDIYGTLPSMYRKNC